MKKERAPRDCSMCMAPMWSGFVLEGDTYCDEDCRDFAIEKTKSKFNYENLHELNPDEYYWTEWEESDQVE